MIKIDKRYCIKYTYAGIRQYLTINESKGKIITTGNIHIDYKKEPVNITNLSLEEIINKIAEFSTTKPELYLINHEPLHYYYNEPFKEDIDNLDEEFKDFKKEKINTLFYKHIRPVLIERDFKLTFSNFMRLVIIKKDDEGEWRNVTSKDEMDIQYNSYKILNKFHKIDIDLKFEQHLSIDAFHHFIQYLDINKLKEEKLFIEL